MGKNQSNLWKSFSGFFILGAFSFYAQNIFFEFNFYPKFYLLHNLGYLVSFSEIGGVHYVLLSNALHSI